MNFEELSSPIPCPSTWNLVRLKDICRKIGSGATPTGGQAAYLQKRENYVLVRSQNVFDRIFSQDGLAFISDEQAKGLKNVQLEMHDLLLNITGDGVTFGRACMVPESILPACVNQHVSIIRVDQSKADASYVLSYLTHPLIKTYIESFNAGGSRRAITKGHIESFILPLPPLPVQKAIGAILSLVDNRIALLHETNVTLESIAHSLFKSWFVDFDPVRAKQEGRLSEGMNEETAELFPNGFKDSELGELPTGWNVATVGHIAEVIDCLHAKKPELLPKGHPFLQLNNIRDDGLLDTSNVAFISQGDYNKWVSRIEVREGDCVITNVGRVGAVAQIPSGFRAAIGRNMTAIRLREEWPYPTYMIELLQSAWMREEIRQRTDIGTILNALNVRNIPALRCALPNKKILNAFETACRPLRASMEANLQRANTLASLRDTLLPRLVSGRLRVLDAEEQINIALAGT